jgi:CheY-like chemotaxis protein
MIALRGIHIVKKKYVALVIEDHEDLADVFSEALQMLGFEVEVIRDGGKALARLAEVDPPALILLDMHLPHVSGKNILRQIHTDRRLLNTRIMVATADSVMADEVRKQADIVVLKPLTFDQLLSIAQELVPGVRPPSPIPPAEADPTDLDGEG